MALTEKLTAIADAIREKTGGNEGLTLDRMATGIGDVYDAGKQAEHDAFWDSFAQNTDCTYLYAGASWNRTTFRPKNNMLLSGNCNYIFANSMVDVDLVSWLEDLGISLSLSNVTAASQAFRHSRFIRLGVLDFSVCSILTNAFQEMRNLKQIDKLILSPNGISNVSSVLSECPKLESVTIEGVIAGSGINMSASVLLSGESIVSIINALSTSTSGKSIALSLAAVNNAFETASGLADGSTSAQWLALIGTRSNWTISLA